MYRVTRIWVAVAIFCLNQEVAAQQASALLNLQYELTKKDIPLFFSNPVRAAGVYLGSGSDFVRAVFTVDQDSGMLIYLIAQNDSVTHAGFYGDGGGEVTFNAPQGVDVDESGNLYVADTGNNRIVRLHVDFSSGAFTHVSNITGITNPVDVVITNSSFWVLSESQNKVMQYSLSGSLQYSLGSSGSGNGKFSSPRGISARQSNGTISSSDIYVADTGNDRVVFFTKGSSSGNYAAWNTVPISNSTLTDIASDPDGNAYAMDAGQGRLHVIGWSGKDYLGYASESFNQPKNVNFAPGKWELGTIEAWTNSSGVSQYDVRVEILNLSASASGSNVTFSYILMANADMTGKVKDSGGQVVRDLMTNSNLPAASNHQHTWDGRNNSGNPVPAGQYTFELTANTSHGQNTKSVTFTYDGGGGGGQTTRIEAENMTLSNYDVENNASWSGGKGIKLDGSNGTARTTPPAAGTYDVKVTYLDEADGPATIEIRIDGSLRDSWTLNQNTDQLITRTVVSGYNFASNSVFEIKGIKNSGEYARIDYVEFVGGGGGCTTYTLTTNVQGSGSISSNPSGGSFCSGTQVTLTANPASGWTFQNWSGALSGSTNPATLTMNGNKTVTAVFQQSGGGGQTARIEAESMTLSNYTVENNASWSGGKGIKLDASNGTARTSPPLAGTYDVKVTYLDETDGPAKIEIRIDGALKDSWNLNQNTEQLITRTVVTGYNFSSNAVFEIKGIKSSGEYARIDYVEFVGGGGGCTTYTLTTNVQGSGSISLNPSGGSYCSGTQVTLTANPASGWTFQNWSGALSGSTNPATITMISNKTVTAVFQQSGGGGGQTTRIEAESMTLSNYIVESNSSWSGGSGIKLDGSNGTARTNPPSAGAYDVKVVYLDEADGPATIEIRIGGTLVDSWTLNQNTDQLVSRTVVSGYNFNSNTVFEIKGIRNNGEHARIDYVEFTSTSAKIVALDADAPRANVPDRLSLIGNFPNPFNPSTRIKFTVPVAMEVSLEIFSITGQRIRTIVGAIPTLGEHTIVWDGRDDDGLTSPSGIYVYRLKGGGVVAQGRMSLVR